MDILAKAINEEITEGNLKKYKHNYKTIQDKILGPKSSHCKTNKDWKKRWKQVVKEDYDWDGSHLFILILIKLHYMLEYFEHGYICVQEEYDKILISLREAVELGDKIWADEYEDAAMEFGRIHCQHREEQRENGIVCWGEWDNEENSKVWHDMIEAAWQTKQADELKFFTIIAEHYNEWWD